MKNNYFLSKRNVSEWKAPYELELDEIVNKSSLFICKHSFIRKARALAKKYSTTYEHILAEKKFLDLKSKYVSLLRKYIDHSKRSQLITVPQASEYAMNVIKRYAQRFGGYGSSLHLVSTGTFHELDSNENIVSRLDKLYSFK